MPAICQEFRTVALPREQYLRKEEVRIRDLALPIHSSDPAVAKHLDIILKLEDIIDIHEAAENRQRQQGAHRVADHHRDFAAALLQIKFHHLDQLAHLLV